MTRKSLHRIVLAVVAAGAVAMPAAAAHAQVRDNSNIALPSGYENVALDLGEVESVPPDKNQTMFIPRFGTLLELGGLDEAVPPSP